MTYEMKQSCIVPLHEMHILRYSFESLMAELPGAVTELVGDEWANWTEIDLQISRKTGNLEPEPVGQGQEAYLAWAATPEREFWMARARAIIRMAEEYPHEG